MPVSKVVMIDDSHFKDTSDSLTLTCARSSPFADAPAGEQRRLTRHIEALRGLNSDVLLYEKNGNKVYVSLMLTYRQRCACARDGREGVSV